MKKLIQRLQKHLVFAGGSLFFCLFSFYMQAQTVIPFAKGVAEVKERKLSEIASKVQYIPLETTADNLLDDGGTLNAAFVGKYLFVCDEHHIYQFTPEGKYIRKIGQRGSGPGEFAKYILAVVYDEAKEHIIATDYRNGRAIVFSFEGKYLYDLKIKGKITAFQKPGLLYGTTSEYLVSKDRTGCDMYIMDDKGQMVENYLFNYVEGKMYPRVLLYENVIFYSYRGNIYSKNFFENQIYRIEGKKKVPAYALDLGDFSKYENEDPDKFVFDKEKGVGTNIRTEAGKKRFLFSKLFETDHHLFVRYCQGDGCYLGVYDKQTRKVSRVCGAQMEKDGFTDDLEGGVPFIPVCGNEKVLINMIPAESLLGKVKPSQAKGSLKKALDNLLEDDNLVLQVVTLK